MGVNGLWKLLGPVARPIALERLADKRLAIDVSIWMYQFQMAMRDKKTGDTLQGAHIMGTFQRIIKLLYHGIKPVFVFDGDAPMLKKRTIAERKRRKEGATRDHGKAAKQLLSAQLRVHAMSAVMDSRKSKSKGKGRADPESYDTGDQIGENAVYLEDLDRPSTSSRKRAGSGASTSALPIPPSPLKRFIPKDQYALPILDEPLETRAKAKDPRIATEEEQRDFWDDMRPEDLDSDLFASLPVEQKYEIIGDMRVRSRQVNHKRVNDMRNSTTPLDFSKAQIMNLMQRNTLTQKLFSVTDELGQSSIAIPTRVAGERNREYVLVKQDAKKGGGWVLGIHDPAVLNPEPIVIDSTDESIGGTDSDEFEEVGIPETKRPATPPVERSYRRNSALEAIIARNLPDTSAALDPFLDQPAASRRPSLFQNNQADFEYDDSMDPEFQATLMASLDEGYAGGTESRHPANGNGGTTTRRESRLDEVDTATLVASPSPVPLQQESEDSDDFEEVHYEASNNRPPHANSTTKHQSPPPIVTPRFPPQRSLMESILPSDSESDSELHVVETSTVPPRSRKEPSPPSDTMKEPSPPRKQPAPPIIARDYGATILRVEPAPATGSAVSLSPIKKLLPGEPFLPAPLSPSPSQNLYDTEFNFTEEAISTIPDLPAISAEAAVRTSITPVSSLATLTPSSLVQNTSVVEHPVLPPGFVTSTEQLTGDIQIELDSTLALMEEEAFSSAMNAQISEQVSLSEKDSSKETSSSKSDGEEVVQLAKAVNSARNMELDVDSDEDPEWERSPTPPPRQQPLFAEAEAEEPVDYEEEPEFIREEQEELKRNLEREQEQYVEMVSDLTNKSLEDMRKDAEAELANARALRNQAQRNADGVTRAMATDIKELLRYFGIPWVDAPEEAEAECAELLSLELVDGIVTDDSDVFLFGGSTIYRNMFNDAKYVECYLMKDLEKELGLDRDKLVRLAYLLGGDYADGLKGVGPVLGRELLEEFEGKEGLTEFKQWWGKVQSGKDTEEDNFSAWRRKFKSGHKSLFLDENWPNPVIARAYYKPTVNEEKTPFSWSGMDLDGLRSYLHMTLGRSEARTTELLTPLINRQNQRKSGKIEIKAQRTIDRYFFSADTDGAPLPRRAQAADYSSTRLKNVVQSYRNRKRAPEEIPEVDKSDEEVETSQSKERPAPPKRRKSSAASIQQEGINSTSEASSSKSTTRKRKETVKSGPRQTAAQKRKAAKEKADLANEKASDSNKDDDEEFVPAVNEPRPRARRIAQKSAIVESGSDGEEVVRTVERNLGTEMLNSEEVAAEERLWA